MTSLNDYRLYGSKKADASIDLSAPVAAPVVEDDTFEEEKAAATASVPTSTSKKEDVRAYLMYEHGVDPGDMQDMTKADLLSLVADLEA